MFIAASIAAGVTGSLPAQGGSRLWRPEERIVLRDYGFITALATTGTQMFAATPRGIAVYDSPSRRWMPPLTELDAFPPEPAIAALGDPADQSVWFGTATMLVHYTPLMRQVEQIPVEGPVTKLMFDRADSFRGIYFVAGGRWRFLPRGSTWPRDPPSLPPAGRRLETVTADEMLRRDPVADALRSRALVDDRLRQFEFTAFADDQTRRLMYFGTNGAGVVRYDPATTRFEPMPFGLLSDDVSAVLADGGDVWVGTGVTAERTGFTRMGSGLQYFEHFEGPRATGYRFNAVGDLVKWNGEVWAATDQGVVRVGDSRVAFDNALPSRDVRSLLVTANGLWIGTTRGLALAPAPGEALQSAGNAGTFGVVNSLATLDGQLWIGGSYGLASLEGSVEPNPEYGVREEVVDLDTRGETIVVGYHDRIAWRFQDDEWNTGRRVPELGFLTAVAVDDEGAWLGGATGLGYFAFRSRSFQLAAVATDLPGVVRDIAVDGGFVWVATEGGLVRFERRALGL